MSNYELNEHKRSDTIKWILTLIAFVIVGVLLTGILCGWFVKKEEEHEEASSGGAIISQDEDHGISVMAAKLSATEYADHGVSALADSAYTLTATVQPNFQGEKHFDWSVSFKNASSSWANGKNVTDYVTVAPTADGANTATVTCKQAFGEQILVKCTSREFQNVSATCNVDYAQRITGMTVTLQGSRTGNVVIPEGEDVSIDFIYYGGTSSYNVYTVTATPIYSDTYTLAETATCQVDFLASAGEEDSHTYFNGNGVSGSYGYYSRSVNEDVLNAIGKKFSFDNHMFEAYPFRHEYSELSGGYPVGRTADYKDFSAEQLAERYLTQDHDTVLWRVVASVEGKYGSYVREDSYLMYVWSSAGNYATLNLSESELVF